MPAGEAELVCLLQASRVVAGVGMGASPSSKNAKLGKAASQGDLQVVKRLVTDADVDINSLEARSRVLRCNRSCATLVVS